MINNLNKNISVWRGDSIPPTDYHLWEKSDGTILTKIENEWELLTSPKDKETLDYSISDINIGQHTNEELNLNLIDNNKSIKKSLQIPISSKEKSGLITAEDKLTLYNSIKSGKINSNVDNPELVLKDNNDTEHNISIPISDGSQSGFMSTVDKIKLDNAIYDLGDFNLSSEAELKFADSSIGLDPNKTIIRYTVNGAGPYIVIQSLNGNNTTQFLILKGLFYFRYVTYNSDKSINTIGSWSSTMADSLGWSTTYHRYELFFKGKKLNGNMASIPEGTNGTLGLIDPNKFTIQSTPSSEGLKLNLKYSGSNTLASAIIPNDTSIKDVQIATMDSTIDSNGNIIIGTGETALSIVYILSDKTYKLVNISLSKFLEEQEFGDGLKVDNHKVSIKKDSTSEDFLTVSSNGIKISGLDSKFTKLDNDISSINTNNDSQSTKLQNHIDNTGNPHQVTAELIGLGNVNNTSDVNKPVSTALLKAISDAKNEVLTNLNAHTSKTDNPHNVTKAQVGLGNVDNTSDKDKPVSTLQSSAINSAKSEVLGNLDTHIGNKENPHEVTKIQIGLGNVDNTSDLDKPVSTAVQTELNNKVDKVEGKGLSTLDFTNAYAALIDKADRNYKYNTVWSIMYANGVVSTGGNVLITKDTVGLGNVDNTSDANKPISTATQNALDDKVDKITGKSLVSDTEITKLSGLKTQAELNTSIADAKKAGTDAQTSIDNHKANKDLQHIPTGGASNLILIWESSGKAKWETLEPCTTEEINSLFE